MGCTTATLATLTTLTTTTTTTTTTIEDEPPSLPSAIPGGEPFSEELHQFIGLCMERDDGKRGCANILLGCSWLKDMDLGTAVSTMEQWLSGIPSEAASEAVGAGEGRRGGKGK